MHLESQHGATSGAYANQATLGNDHSNIPPAEHINADQHGGGGSRFAGKVESAVGSMVGSQALKERGYQKEQEANAFKTQSAEIGEAERLEKEAMLRRERAVASGAHPDNRYLGGINAAQSNNTGVQNDTRTGRY